MTSQLWWYLARAAGIVSWTLVAISVCWGLLLAGGCPGPASFCNRRVA